MKIAVIQLNSKLDFNDNLSAIKEFLTDAKREKAEKKNTSNVELESNEPVPAASGSSRDSSEYEANKNEIPKTES